MSVSAVSFPLGSAALRLIVLLLLLPSSAVGPALSAEDDHFMSAVPVSNPLRYPPVTDVALSKGRFLVASREMKDPRFAETVIFLVDYSTQGAMGLIVNRLSDAKLSNAFPEMKGLRNRTDALYFGGPVRVDQMFMLVRAAGLPPDSQHVFKDVYVSGSRALLEQMVDKGESGKKFHVFAGYAGWSPQQLDREVALGGWHVMPADPDVIFEKEPSLLWPELIRRSSLKWVRTGPPESSAST